MGPGDIAVIYGDSPEQMIGPLFDYLNIIDDIPPDSRIGIKPNLVLSQPSETGATTDPEIVSCIIAYLKRHGLRDLVILESAWVGDTTQAAYRVCGYETIAERYQVELIDLKADDAQGIRAGGTVIDVCNQVLEIDYLINAPVLKAHCQTKFTCALKNLKGCIPDSEKRRFHSMGLHKPIATLNTIIKTDLVVVDGIIGDLTFEEGGTPVQMNRIIVGKDPVLVDAYGATLIGYDPREIAYISLAENLGVGKTDLTTATIHELNQAENTGFDIPSRQTMDTLSTYINENQACSACVGSLIHALKRLEEKGQLTSIPEQIAIGQGFKAKTGNGIGVGSCTSGLSQSLKGCPPNARKIVDFVLAMTT